MGRLRLDRGLGQGHVADRDAVDRDPGHAGGAARHFELDAAPSVEGKQGRRRLCVLPTRVVVIHDEAVLDTHRDPVAGIFGEVDELTEER